MNGFYEYEVTFSTHKHGKLVDKLSMIVISDSHNDAKNQVDAELEADSTVTKTQRINDGT